MEDAEIAARRFAEYFDLDTEFRDKIETYARNKNKMLISLQTIHYNPSEQTFHEIRQSKDAISIKKTNEPKYKRNKKKGTGYLLS